MNSISANIIEQVSEELDVSLPFCYLIVALIGFLFLFALLSWIFGHKRRKRRELALQGYKLCPVCGGTNKPDAIICEFCDESLD